MGIETKILENIDGKEVVQIRLKNKNGIIASFLTLGATWQEFLVPTDSGEKNLLLGFEQPSDYFKNTLYASQVIGRVAGRIAKGQAVIDGQLVQLPMNNNGHCLHGGPGGFHTLNWSYRLEEGSDFTKVVFSQRIRSEWDGFPGDLEVSLEVMLDDDNRLSLIFKGSDATASTLFNPTIHPYFNLSCYQDLHSHTLQIEANSYLETDADLIPSGDFIKVQETAYDFRKGQNLGAAITKSGGFDDAFVVDKTADAPVLVLRDEDSGDQLSVYSDRQGVVIYTMNSLEDGVYFARDKGLEGRAQEGVAIEPQHLPDAVHHEHFDDIVMRQGEEKSYQIIFAYANVT
ncbi:aldose epimerase family protein [Streptococcus plurextorum]|uniref:aldose epimerase family protein n=1 Tax=Streptococcus plurextorum TaxID=456876 RepID=UPI0004074D56|nr:aldose epimerase family protein [Streptococcus plurextorum]